jgi:ribose 5-phosphate isomerase A
MDAEPHDLRGIADLGVIGLGTGHAATAFLHGLARRVWQALRVRGIPTSKDTEEPARHLDIPLTTLDQIEFTDLAVDRADEVVSELNLIKGLGGAALREKIVAAARRLSILVGEEKLVPVLGKRG